MRSTRQFPRFGRRAKPGAPPGTLLGDPDATTTAVNIIRFNADTFAEERIDDVRGIPLPEDDGLTLWVDVVGLGDIALIERIGERFGFHSLALEDVVNVHERPKMEAHDDHLYVVLRMVAAEPGTQTEQVSIFLSAGLVLTFQERPGDCFEPVRDRLRRGKGRIRALQPDYLFYALIDAVVDRYYPWLESCGGSLEQLEDDVLADPHPRHIERLHALKRELLAVRRAVWPARDVLSALMREETPFIADTTRVYLRDAYDHSVQLIDIVETYHEISSGLIEGYLSSLSAKMNEVMKVLTIMATVFLPLTFITGLYGMNFDRASAFNMPELGWRFGYFFSLAAMFLSAVGLLYYFWRKGWLARERRRDRT